MKRKLHLVVMFMLMAPLVWAGSNTKKNWAYEKSKTISKAYDVNADALLKIRNKYGNLDVVSWDQNRVEIEVKITVSGNNESKVISRLEEIDVHFENSASMVSAKTVIGSGSKSWYKSGNKLNYEINYKVKMPRSNSADFGNDYGSISLNELDGKANIHCDYGKVQIGSLNHSENVINMDYTSNSEIEFMNGGEINADYSKLHVEKAKNVDLTADYTNTSFGHLENLKFVCDYGKLEVGNGNVIDGHGDYLTMKIGTVYKKLNIRADYGSLRVEKLMKGFESVSVNSDYTGIKMGLESGIAFNFTAKLSYGGFDFDSENITFLKKIVKSSSKYYEGFINQENSGATVTISSEYGGVKLYNH